MSVELYQGLPDRIIGQRIDQFRGQSPEEFAQALGLSDEDTVHTTGYLYDWTISVTNQVGAIFDVAYQLVSGEQVNATAKASISRVFPCKVWAAYVDHHDATAVQDVRYTINVQTNGTLVNGDNRQGHLLRYPFCPSMIANTNSSGALTVRVTRFRTDGSTEQTGTGRFILMTRPLIAPGLFVGNKRVRLTQFNA